MCKILQWNYTVSEIALFSLLSLSGIMMESFLLPFVGHVLHIYHESHPMWTDRRAETDSPSLRVSTRIEYEGTKKRLTAERNWRKERERTREKWWLVVVNIENCLNDLWKFPSVNPVRIQFFLNLLSLNSRLLYISNYLWVDSICALYWYDLQWCRGKNDILRNTDRKYAKKIQYVFFSAVCCLCIMLW